LDEIELKCNSIPFLNGKNKGRINKNSHACQFVTDENLNSILNADNSYIIVNVEARHSISGILESFTKDLMLENIHAGMFEQGDSCKIIESRFALAN